MSSIITFTNTQDKWTCNMQLPDQFACSRFTGAANHWINKLPVVQEEEDDDDDDDSSSIGKNSDGDDDVSYGEVTSKDNSGAFSGLNELEAALPIKRGISKFYAGKSKSYGSLDDAVTVSSIQDIVKKEDAYSRKRKNMIAHSVLLEQLRNFSSENGVSKRLARSAESGDTKKSSFMVGGGRPPLYRSGRKAVNDGSLDSSRKVYRAPLRSLSLSDLMSEVTDLASSKRDEEV